MNDHEYALLILQLAAVAQRPDAFDGLDGAQLENLAHLLKDAHHAADVAWQARLRAEREVSDERP